jgi:hypothetical protein
MDRFPQCGLLRLNGYISGCDGGNGKKHIPKNKPIEELRTLLVSMKS